MLACVQSYFSKARPLRHEVSPILAFSVQVSYSASGHIAIILKINPMRFGEGIRDLRRKKRLSQKALAEKLSVSDTYLSKVENQRLDFREFPSEKLIHKLADALDGDETELLLLAEKVPEVIKRRLLERPDAFIRIAELNDDELDEVLERLG